MKRSVLMLMVMSFLLIAIYGFSADRVSMLDFFTSSTCGPCVSANRMVDGFMSNQINSVPLVVMRSHMNWPSPNNDPMYANDPEMNNARRAYYGVNAVPQFYLNGLAQTVSVTADQLAAIVARENAKGSDFTLKVTQRQEGNNIIATVTATLDNGKTLSNNVYLRVALIENDLQYKGTNGEPVHQQALRAMYPDYEGTGITQNETVVNATFAIKGAYVAANLTVIAFIQNDDTKEILQSWSQAAFKPFRAWSLMASNTVTFLDNNTINNIGPFMIKNGTEQPIDATVTFEGENVPGAWSVNLSEGTGEDALLAPLRKDVTTLQPGETKEIYVQINPGLTEGKADISIACLADVESNSYTGTATYSVINTTAQVLMVDFWNSTAEDYEDSKDIVPEAMDDLSYYHYYYSDYDGIAGGINQFKIIFWTGFHSVYNSRYYWPNVTSEHEALFADYLDQGGNLLIASRWYIFNVYVADMSTSYIIRFDTDGFVYQYLGIRRAKVTGLVDNSMDPNAAPKRMYGVDGNPISNGIDQVRLDNDNAVYCPALYLRDGYGVPVFTTPDFDPYNTLAVGRELDSGGKALFFSIPFELIIDANQRKTILQKCMAWLEHPMDVKNDKPQIDLKNLTMGPNPFNANLKINFTAPLVEDATLRVFDLQGSLVGKVQINKGLESWSINSNKALLSLPTGTYIFKVKSGKDEVVQKLVKLQ